MKYREIKPGHKLESLVKCFYIYEAGSDALVEDTVFPSGCMEIIFNLGAGRWQTGKVGENNFTTTPMIELWGQIVRPMAVRSIGKNTMLGARFYPHAAACFLKENIDLFNNQVVDFTDLSGKAAKNLHERLLETDDWEHRLLLVEEFLWSRLSLSSRKNNRIETVSDIMKELLRDNFCDNIETVASRYGITARYLQKLFLQYTGLTPKLYSKINRFQNSLRLVGKKDTTLTSIAYDCGYFDQSHFIRDFKSFTGFVPSGYTSVNSPISFALANS